CEDPEPPTPYWHRDRVNSLRWPAPTPGVPRPGVAAPSRAPRVPPHACVRADRPRRNRGTD
ncbi:MAG: hypothetical protein AVDCRST_MAG73-3287, partial [uncultured Thermomicrobiales bacterium]